MCHALLVNNSMILGRAARKGGYVNKIVITPFLEPNDVFFSFLGSTVAFRFITGRPHTGTTPSGVDSVAYTVATTTAPDFLVEYNITKGVEERRNDC